MFLSLVSKFVASLLVTVLSSTIITVVLTQTVLSSHYLEGQLTATHSYSRLSDALSDQVAQSSGIASPTIAAVTRSILTPTVLKAKLDSTLDQLQAYYRGNGPVPVIDLTDLATQAQAAGIPLGSNSGLTKPITLGSTNNSTTAKNGGSVFRAIQLGSIIASLVLATILALLCWRRKDVRPLLNVLISVGISIGLIALFFTLAPGLLNHFIKFNSNASAFTSVGNDLATAIARNIGSRFGIIATSSLIAGIGGRIWLHDHHRRTLQKHAAPDTLVATMRR